MNADYERRLRTFMEARGIPPQTIEANLSIARADAWLAEAIKLADQYANGDSNARLTLHIHLAGHAGVMACDGWRTSPDGLTRTKIAPDAAAPTVPSESVTLHVGADGRLHPSGVLAVDPLRDTGPLGYAARLADGLWRKHYQQDAPNWQLCPDLLGILTQIDNMTTGLMKKPTAGVAMPAPTSRRCEYALGICTRPGCVNECQAMLALGVEGRKP